MSPTANTDPSSSRSDPNNPWAPSVAYLEDDPDRRLMDDIYGGTRTLRAHPEYLPQMPREADEHYERRRETAVLYNATKRTLKGLAGMVFRKNIVIDAGENDAFRDHAENIDLEGRNLDVFAREVTEAALRHGLTHVLVDHTQAGVDDDRTPSRGEVRQLGQRPYWVHLTARQLIGWRSALVGGREILTQVRYVTRGMRPEGDYGEELHETLRVLSRETDEDGMPVDAPVRYEAWRRKVGEGGRGELVEEGELDVNVIPLATIYSNRAGFMRADPPLMDLAEENLRHYRCLSTSDRGLDVAQYPHYVFVGLEDEEDLEVGPLKATRLPMGGSAEILESSGNALGAADMRLQRSAERMAILGLSMLHSESRAAETARAKEIDKAEQDSELAAVARGVEDALNEAVIFHAMWLGREDAATVEVNKDFNVLAITEGKARAMMDLVERGLLSRPTLWEALRIGEWLPDTFDPDHEARLIEEDGGGLGFPDPRIAGAT
jgi:hypothetical protein